MVCYCKRYMLPDLSEYIYPIIPLMPVSVKVPLLIRSFHSPKSAIFGSERIIQVLCSERALCAMHDLILTRNRCSPSLSYISVQNCSLLEKRCQFEKGEEWPYISHVPKIEINFVLI